MTAPILIFGWGNPARGDDGLGPAFVERLEALHLPGIECLTDFQLQPEHALDLAGRQFVLFVDAGRELAEPYAVRRLAPAAQASFDRHAASPEAVMQVYVELHDQAPPPCALLVLRGSRFALGEALSAEARTHLDAACTWAERLFSGRSTFPARTS